MQLILIGIQGSGKSTQGNLLSEKFGIPYLSTGQIFREIAKEATPDGKYIKETMNAGYLIPDERVLQLINEYLNRPDYQNGFILDGFPRTTAQAEAFTSVVDKVIYLKVSDEEALKRIAGRKETREDETPEAIKRRIELFHNVTEPVLDYYRNKGLLLEVNGEQTIDTIFNDILSKLE
jgi:adenylate kinase